MATRWQSFAGVAPFVDPDAFVHAAAVLIGNVRVGAGSSIWPCATLRGDDGPIVVGAQSSIQDGAVVHMTAGLSSTSVGDRVTVGHNAILHGCTIEDDCIVGMGAIVLDNAVIGCGSIVGAGTLVPMGKRVPPGTVVVGNPMRVLRGCREEDIDFIRFSWQSYVARALEYKAQARAQAGNDP